jgi:hypothetical protein
MPVNEAPDAIPEINSAQPPPVRADTYAGAPGAPTPDLRSLALGG